MGIFTDSINCAWDRTGTILFRPFRIKKWLVLAVAAWLAGTLSGGAGNFNFPSQRKSAPVQHSVSRIRQDLSGIRSRVVEKLKDPRVAGVGIAAGVAMLGLMLLFLWLYSRFTFVFTHNVAFNDASIRKPFGQYRKPARSLFLFSFLLGILGVLVMGGVLGFGVYFGFKAYLAGSGGWNSVFRVMLTEIPFVLALTVAMIVFGTIGMLVVDLFVPVMMKSSGTLGEAWQSFSPFLRRNKMSVLLYVLLRAGLGFAMDLIYGMLATAVLLLLILPLTGIGVGGIVVVKGLHVSFAPLIKVLLVCLLALWALGTTAVLLLIKLPVAVFMRSLSLSFLGKLAPDYAQGGI